MELVSHRSRPPSHLAPSPIAPPPMSEELRPDSLLDQLDALQDHVLTELDALDVRILGMIRDCTQSVRLAPATVPVDSREAA